MSSLPHIKTPIDASENVMSLVMSLPPRLNIETIETVTKELQAVSFKAGSVFTLDVANVESISTPGGQLIVSLQKALKDAECQLVITGRSESFDNFFKDIGFPPLPDQSA